MAVKTAKKQRNMRFSAETVYIGEYIDLKKIQENIKRYTYLNRDHPLVIRLLKEQFAVLTKFGAVTFWNTPDRLRKQFLSEIKPFVKSRKDHYPYDEDTKVITGRDTDKVTFEKVYLTDFGVDKIKIISYVLSQSVALERYEDEIEQNLADIGLVVENLKSTGRALLGERALLKKIGEILSVKQIAVAHLSLFDKPEEVWEFPELEDLYNKLHSEYELRARFDILDKKIKYLSDTAQMLMNFLAEKRNAFLELVIIILIAIEIVLFLPSFKDFFNIFR